MTGDRAYVMLRSKSLGLVERRGPFAWMSPALVEAHRQAVELALDLNRGLGPLAGERLAVGVLCVDAERRGRAA